MQRTHRQSLRSFLFAAELDIVGQHNVKRTPTLDADGWELDDAEVLNEKHPATFDIPSPEERRGLNPGAKVKLVFLFLTREANREVIDGERMWVRVLRPEGPGFLGALEDSPVLSGALAAGDTVYFEPRHVAATIIPFTDPRHPDYAPTALQRFFKRLRFHLPGSVSRR